MKNFPSSVSCVGAHWSASSCWICATMPCPLTQMFPTASVRQPRHRAPKAGCCLQRRFVAVVRVDHFADDTIAEGDQQPPVQCRRRDFQHLPVSGSPMRRIAILYSPRIASRLHPRPASMVAARLPCGRKRACGRHRESAGKAPMPVRPCGYRSRRMPPALPRGAHRSRPTARVPSRPANACRRSND